MSLMHRARRFFIFTVATVIALLGYTYFFYTPRLPHRHRTPTLPGYRQRVEASVTADSESSSRIGRPQLGPGNARHNEQQPGDAGHEDEAGIVSQLAADRAREIVLSQDAGNDGSLNFGASLQSTLKQGSKAAEQDANEDGLFRKFSSDKFAPEELFNLDINFQSVLTKSKTKQELGKSGSVVESLKSKMVYNSGEIRDRIIDASVKSTDTMAQETKPSQNSLPFREMAEDLNLSVNASIRNARLSHLIEEIEKDQFEQRHKQISERLKVLPEEDKMREIQTLRLVKGVNVSALLHFLHRHNSNNSLNTKPLFHDETIAINETKTITGDKKGMKSGGRTLNPDQYSLKNRNAVADGSEESTAALAESNNSVVNSGSGPITPMTRPDSCKGCFQVSIPTLIDHESYCSDFSAKTNVLLLITSAPGNQDKRNAIRQSWGELCQDRTSKYRCLFVIGETALPEHNLMVRSESETFRDILQFQFPEAYSNLTYKTMASLHWVAKNCQQVDYVMKTDDDMYVNTHLVPVLLKAAPKEDFIGGFCWGTSSPHRDVHSKWYVPLSSYAQNRLPPMCSGTGYIMSRDVVRKVLEASGNIPFFHLEDVYVALCLQRQGIRPVRLTGFSNIRFTYNACQYRHHVMTSHEVPSELLPQYWAEGKNCQDETPSPEKLYQPVPLPTLA